MRALRGVVILFLISVCISSTLYGQTKAFKGGEKLRFLAEYKIGLFNVEVATVDFVVNNVEYKRDSCYKVTAVAEVMPQYRWFFDMRDEYNVWMRMSDLKPLYFESDIKEGSYTLVANYVYDWDSLKVNTFENRPVWNEPRRKEHTLSDDTYDAISMFYILRNLPDSALVENKPVPLDLVFANRIRRVQYSYVGREEIKTERFGWQNTLRFRCQLANDSGESFNDGDEFDLWLSDDINRIPLYLESPIRVGTVRAYLFEAEGVVEPLKKKRRRK